MSEGPDHSMQPIPTDVGQRRYKKASTKMKTLDRHESVEM